MGRLWVSSQGGVKVLENTSLVSPRLSQRRAEVKLLLDRWQVSLRKVHKSLATDSIQGNSGALEV